MVVNLWHPCYRGLFVVIESSKMFAITGLEHSQDPVPVVKAQLPGVKSYRIHLETV